MARRKSTPAPTQNPLAALTAAATAGGPGKFTTLRQAAGRALIDAFTGESARRQTDVTLEALREMCRKGNPFPLIGYQWPELLVTDPAEQELFREIPAGGLDFITAEMRAAILNDRNPVLRIDWWQRIILAGIFDVTVSEVFIKGCTGAGKGASVGIANCLWYDVHEECRCTLTSRDYDHAAKGIFGEVKMWFTRMRFPAPGNVLGESIGAHERRYIDIKNPAQTSGTAGEAFSGQHGKATLYTADEATAIVDTIFENMEKNARKIIALANPRVLAGRFRDAFRPLGVNENRIAVCRGTLGNRLCVTVAGMDCMNVRRRRLKSPTAPAGGIKIGDREYSAGDRITDEHHAKVTPLITSQIDLNQYMGILSKSDPRLVDVFAHGKFPKEDPDKQVILRSWLDPHIAAHAIAPPAVDCFALDVARSVDGDQSCLSAGGADGCHSLKFWQYADINQLCGAVLSHAREAFKIELNRGRNPIVVDCDGLGSGAVDILRAAGAWVIEYHGNGTSEVDPKIYGNTRAEAYAVLGRRLNPDDRWRGRPWAIPDSKELHEELCAPEKEYSADALRFHITPKNTAPGKENVVSIKKKIGRSPDAGDSVAMLFHGVRIFHNMNEWFRAATRDLVLYPVLADKHPPAGPNGEPVKPPPDTNELTIALREQYGKLLDKPEKQEPPDWLTHFRREATDRDDAARQAQQQNNPTPAGQEQEKPRTPWQSRVFQGD